MDPRVKPCKVVLEPCTPKSQLSLSKELRNIIYDRNLLTARSKKKFISALDEMYESNEEVKRREYKENVYKEILETEGTYLKQLEIIMTFFMTPLKMRRILKEEEFESVFGGIETIYEVNGALLDELKTDLSNLAKAFAKLAPFFKLYSSYAYNFTTTMAKLQDLHLKNHQFSKFIENQETRPEVQSKLSSLLILPIQRVPRYCLLLRDLLNHTDHSEPDYDILKDSVQQLEETTKHINNQIAERENSQRLLELQRSLMNSKPPLIQPDRRLIKEGVVKMVDIHSEHDKKVYVILLNDLFMWCKIKKQNIRHTDSLKCSGSFPIQKCRVKYSIPLGELTVSHDNDTVTFYHESLDETTSWLNTIEETIKTAVANRASLRKQSSSRTAAFKRNLKLQYRGRNRIEEKGNNEIGVREEKKRKLSGAENEECFSPCKIFKRKAINDRTLSKSILQNSLSTGKRKQDQKQKTVTFSKESPDSLYPLRVHLQRSEASEDCFASCENKETNVEEDLYVFGSEQKNRGFRFKFSNVFAGIGNSISEFGNSIKRLFTFR